MKHTEHIEFDTVINGLEICIGFTRTIVWGRENYGAAADGNRGMIVDMVDADEYTEVVVTSGELTIGIAQFIKRDKAIAAIEAYLESHPPEAVEPPERDYNDDRDERDGF